MRRRVLLCLTLIAMSACNGDKVVQPTASPSSSTNAISDATHSALGVASNSDFFFLPPMVKNPSGSPQWNAGAFNPDLKPTVEICDLNATSESGVATASCVAATSYSASVSPADEQYQLNWKVPKSSTIFYRITVKVGATRLGFADVETGTNGSALKNVATGEFVPLVDGQTLPIKFRIERYALCAVPGTGPCTSVSGDLAVAPITASSGTPDASGISSVVGVTIPVQQATTPGTVVTVTFAPCPNLNPTVIDLPTFGECVRVTTDPVLPRLTNPAIVFVCAVGVSAPLFGGLSEEQEERVTLHRYDATGPHQGLVALPHAHACTPGTPGGVASTSPTLRGMLASLAHRQFRSAASQAVALLAPKPLYAARRFIDLGGGGFTEAFSDFQFALPAKMEIVPATDNQVVPPGTTLNPTVKVTDLGGEAVRGAVVHFFSNDPASALGIPVITGADGLATAPWIIAPGTSTLPASGRGIATANRNGPRRSSGAEIDDVVDPFQPISSHFDGGGVTPGGEVAVLTGSVSFTATGSTGEIVVFNDVNVFDDFAMSDPNNQQLVRNLVNFTGAGPRAGGSAVVMSSGHGTLYPDCFAQSAVNTITGQDYAFSKSTQTPIGALAANVKVLILCLPTTGYDADEITSLKQFAAEGGRIIFVGEHGQYYTAGIPIQNAFLSNMGAAMQVTGDTVNCGRNVLSAPVVPTHPVMAGVVRVAMGCSSRISTLGEGDVALYFGSGEYGSGKVLSGVAKLGNRPAGLAAARVQSTAAPSLAPSSDDPLGRTPQH